jgi:cyclopropane fatty-acyl-phospholipid synthase-like methyltransferase
VSEDLRRLARAALVFNAPLSEERAADLVERLVVAPGGHVLDLCCGRAELLLRVVAARPGTTGTGVDVDRPALDRARARAAALRLLDRVDLVEADVTAFGDRGDVVLCVGAAHAWGGAAPALAALTGHLQPGGLLLLGDGFWAAEPGDEALGIFGDLPAGLDALAEAATRAGFRVVDAAASSQAEWDAFESGWRDGLLGSGRPEAVALARDRQREYERAYRGVLGFAWLVLAV